MAAGRIVSPIGAGRFAGRVRLDQLGRAAQHARPGAAGRQARLHALLAGRAPQHAADRQLRAGNHDRPRRQRHEKHSRRLRRHDAAESHAAEGGGNVSRPRGAASRPRGPRPRPRARHRLAHRARSAPVPRSARRRRFPRAPQRSARVSSITVSRRIIRSSASAPCPTTCPCRKSGCSARAIFPPSFPRRWDCASPSRTTLRRGRRSARCDSTANIFSRRNI